jgi:tRNA/tmRNA/rRNA uracil-C5-methylase (TrmA/RlmC/RlmD family)
LLDICCGTGAIGICLSQRAKKIVGIELIEQAIVNAKANVVLNKNKIDPGKCEFFAGKAEELLPNLVKEYTQ